jgi:deoxyribose-phosphate aldolase
LHSTLKIENFLESTLLNPRTQKSDIEELCLKALKYNFFGVCISPYFVAFAASILQGSNVKIISVAGFPLGFSEGIIKAREAEEAAKKGAREIDMVINLCALKDRDSGILVQEIKDVVDIGITVKVIIETGYLTEEEVALACNCLVEAGAHFVKTSTGLGPRGASLEDIYLLRSLLPPDVGIKASGGISSARFAWDLINAGASRIGTSSAEEILLESINVDL